MYSERIVPGIASPGIVAIHLKRYEFASPFVEHADVLDAGCGAGYGCAVLARGAQRVVGLDRSDEALAYARANYAAANVEFVQGDLLDLPFPDGSFDVVCAFETIEHVEDAGVFLDELARVLRADGTLIVSTPRAVTTTYEPRNPFHRVEFAPSDFEMLLSRSFETVELYGQRRLQTRRHRLLQRVDLLGLRKRLPWLRRASRLLGTPAMADVGLNGLVIERDRIERASELVAVCSGPRRQA
jgi:SAM-dependent methyltransferase